MALDALRGMEYPGRVIVVGRTSRGETVVLYAITGRSPSSQARRLDIDEAGGKVAVAPTDEETLRTGQVELLVYSSIIGGDGAVVVSNGKQTDDIAKALASTREPVGVLVSGQSAWEYEPDEPNYTPRVSGCVTHEGAALSILKRAPDGSVMRNFYRIPLIDGAGRLIATYTGENANPLPSFTGEPVEVRIGGGTAEECVEEMYDALGPAAGAPDFRVSAACAVMDSDGSMTLRVRNRHGQRG